MPDRALNGDRMLARLDQLAEVTATPGQGVTRLAYSAEDRVGRSLVAGWMEDAGLVVHEDPSTNLIGIRPGRTEQMLMTGSHLDTVKQAGHLDGAYGVIAAIEVADTFRRGGVELEHTLIVVGFSNEEGARGTPGMTGSHALAGLLEREWLDTPDLEGITLSERMASTGGDPNGTTVPSVDLSQLKGFIELHIEQGPILESSQSPIGVVQAITGRGGIKLEIRGMANHAGTTPMGARQDALVAAAHVVLAVQELAQEGWVRVATIGVIDVGPGSSNVIPDRATLSIEMRDADNAKIDVAMAQLLIRIEAITRLTGTSYSHQSAPRISAVAADPTIAQCVTRAARSLDLASEPIDSGAGHDAQILARVVPVGMIFVPSSEGVSHSSREYTDPAHLISGAEVLAATIAEADARLAVGQ
jgi:allantoate deiminase